MVRGKYGKLSETIAQRTSNLNDQISSPQFGFRTPNKRTMLEKAASMSGNVTPTAKRAILNHAMNSTGTPKRSNRNGHRQPETPVRKMALKVKEDDPPTPRTTRRKVARSLAKKESDSDSDSETSDKDTSSDEETPVKRKQRAFLHKLDTGEENTDRYFEAHGSSRIITSDKTIDRSGKLTKLTPEELQNVLKKEPLPFAKEIKSIMKEHRSKFRNWMLWLVNDFNILTYGLGSKKQLLANFQQFVTDRDPYCHFVVVNGFFPALSVKQILMSMAEILNIEETFSSLLDFCDAISAALNENNETIYLVIHNIDGLALRSEKAQSVIASLASRRKIKLVASIDHINGPLLWDSAKMSKLNFIWFDATNFLPYSEETMNENSLFARRGACGNMQQMALNSLARVFESLTPNAKEIYITIAKYQMNAVKQLESEESTMYQGISFKDLYQKCRKSFLVNSDLTLRAQLTEFRDHKLIKERKGLDDGIDYLVIPLKNNTLAEFLEQHDIE